MNEPVDRIDTVTRRGLLQAFGLTTGAMALVGAETFLIEPQWLEVTEHKAAIPGLSVSLEGLKIAQISDLHFTSYSKVHDRIIDSLNTKKPDIVLVTGDTLDSRKHGGIVKEFFKALSSPGRQILACMGNREYWCGFKPPELKKEFASVGVHMLVDEQIKSKAGLDIYATDDALNSHDRNSLIKSVGKKNGPRVMISHSPFILDHFPKGPPLWDMALSGHTHGGQVYIGSRTPWLPPGSGRFISGQYMAGPGPVYVSRGIGTTIIDLRFMCRPELPYFTLVRS